MNNNFDMFDRLEKPALTLCNPNREELFSLGLCYETKLTLRFNAISELEFTYPKYIVNPDTRNTTNPNSTSYDVVTKTYNYIKNKRLVLAEDYGYFQITDCQEESIGAVPVKKVKCSSVEIEMVSKKITGLDGTFQFYNVDDSTKSLVDSILEYIPDWTFNHIDTDLAQKSRTFKKNDTTVYNFLINDVSKAYGCVFKFDTVNKLIDAYLIENATIQTDIFLSFNNLIKNSTFSEKSDEITTALSCYGADPLDIRTVNPLGTATIYNFDYYAKPNWMHPSLIYALDAWKTKVTTNQPTYANHLTYLKNLNIRLLALQNGLHHDPAEDDDVTGLAELQSQYDSLDGVRKARIEQGLDITDITKQINDVQTQIDAMNVLIANQEHAIADQKSLLKNINKSLAFDNTDNFTVAQQKELSNYIYASTYQNENIIQTDIMTPAEIQEQAQELYDQGMEVLARVSIPRYEFTVDAVNLLALKEYSETFAPQLKLGAVVTIDNIGGSEDVLIKEDDTGTLTIEAVVLEIVLNFEKPDDFSITFSNRLRLDNGKFVYTDLLDQINHTSTTTSFNASAWANWDENYKNDVTDFINSALDASNNEIINSTNQEIVINQNGLRGRKVISKPGVTPIKYDDNQIWMTSQLLCFTDDAWKHSKLAIGKVTGPDGKPVFGVVANYIVGNLVASNQLIIKNDKNTFVVDTNGATLTNANLTVVKGTNKIIISPTDGIKIQQNSADKFYVDSAGNVVFKGNLSGASGDFTGKITATSGTIGGFKILTDGIYTTDNANYLKSNGDMKWGAFSVTGGNSRFDGTFSADKIVGQIVNTQIASGIDAEKMNGGGMGFSRSGNGKITWAGGAEMTVDGAGKPVIRGDSVSLQTSSYNARIGVNGSSATIYANNDVTIATNGGTVEIASSMRCRNIDMQNYRIMNCDTLTVDSISCDSVATSQIYLPGTSAFHCQNVVGEWGTEESIYLADATLTFVNGLLRRYTYV